MFGHLSEQNTKVIALLCSQKSLIFITCQSAIKSINFNVWSLVGAKYQCYSLTFWPKIAHFHHFSICNQNQSMSILVICRSKISRLWPYFSATNRSFSSLFNLQSKSINFNFGHFSEQNSKVIALLFGQKSLIFITFQSAMKIIQYQVWSFFRAK